MDSSSSGSIQYSGGGDEEFDSRGESFSAFFNSSTSTTSNHAYADMSCNQQKLPSHHQTHHSSLFDPLSPYLDIFTQSTPPSTLNLDMGLSRGFTSTNTTSDAGGLMVSSPSNAQPVPPHRIPPPNSFSMPPSSSHENTPRASVPSDPSNVGVRNPKKRSRASRRAPTTVLTTDTSNFRAMVQEFTGIPPPPFSAPPFLGNRLNLFGNSSAMTMRSGLESPLPFPLRPFAHKVMPPSFLTSMVTNTSNTTTTTVTPTASGGISNTNCSPTSTYNNQLPSELGFPRQSQNTPNMQIPMLALQSHPQPSPRYPIPNVPMFGAKSQTMDSVLEEFNRRNGQLSTDHLGNSSKPLNDEWVFIDERR